MGVNDLFSQFVMNYNQYIRSQNIVFALGRIRLSQLYRISESWLVKIGVFDLDLGGNIMKFF